jgi:hypothetical protein
VLAGVFRALWSNGKRLPMILLFCFLRGRENSIPFGAMWNKDVDALRRRLPCGDERGAYKRVVTTIRDRLGGRRSGQVLEDNAHWIFTRIDEFVWRDRSTDADVIGARMAATGFVFDSENMFAALHCKTLAIILNTSKSAVN